MRRVIYRSADSRVSYRTSNSWKWVGLLPLLLLSACATGPQSEAPVEERGAQPSRQTTWPPVGTHSPGVLVRPLPTPGTTGADSDNPAVKHLVYQAERQARSGNYGLSAASLERALEIAPGDAWIWHRLARVRLAEGALKQARMLARKSTALAGSNPRLLAANRKLLKRVTAKTAAKRP